MGRSGVGVSHRNEFGKVCGKGSTSIDEEMEALKATIAQLESKFEALQASMNMMANKKLNSSVNLAGNKDVTSKPPHQQPNLEAPKKCHLAVMDDDGNLVVVADGTCYPPRSTIMHTSSFLPNHYKVSIDNPYEEHGLVHLPFESVDGVTKIGSAKDYFVARPMSMVLIDGEDNEKRRMSQSKEGVGSCDPLRRPHRLERNLV